MNKVRNILLLIFVTLLCVLCVCCIIFLGKSTGETDYDGQLDVARESQYSNYGRVYLGFVDVIKYVDITGTIISANENYIENVELSGTSDNLLINEGDSFEEGDVIFKNGAGTAYTTKYKGYLDKVAESSGKIVLTLVDYSDRYIELMVPSIDVRNTSVGDELEVDYYGDKYTGVVTYISTYATSGYILMNLSFDDPDNIFKINDEITVRVISESAENVIAVPKETIVLIDEISYVMVQTGATPDEHDYVEVVTGVESNDGWVEIKSGLDEGDIVVYYLY